MSKIAWCTVVHPPELPERMTQARIHVGSIRITIIPPRRLHLPQFEVQPRLFMTLTMIKPFVRLQGALSKDPVLMHD